MENMERERAQVLAAALRTIALDAERLEIVAAALGYKDPAQLGHDIDCLYNLQGK